MSEYIFVTNIFEYSNIFVTLWCKNIAVLRNDAICLQCFKKNIEPKVFQNPEHVSPTPVPATENKLV